MKHFQSSAVGQLARDSNVKAQFAGLAAAEVSPVTGPACPPLSALAQCQESTASAPAREPLGGETNQAETRWKIMSDERKQNK